MWIRDRWARYGAPNRVLYIGIVCYLKTIPGADGRGFGTVIIIIIILFNAAETVKTTLLLSAHIHIIIARSVTSRQLLRCDDTHPHNTP